MTKRALTRLIMLLATSAIIGCGRKPVYFPLETATEPGPTTVGYDTDSNGTSDFFLVRNHAGRVDRLAYDTTSDGRPDEIIDLDALPPDRCRHLVIILDGFGFEVIREAYDQGRLRMFHPPSKVVAPYPTLTDLAMDDLLGCAPSEGFEARYYSRTRNDMVGGTGRYMSGESMMYNHAMDYRADLLWDAVGYIYPWKVFGKEINDIKRAYDKPTCKRQFVGYLVSSAGVGTQQGATGQRRCLDKLEQLITQVLWESHGLTKITLLADHGHSYTQGIAAPVDSCLASKGWHTVKHLQTDRDVIVVRFGLVTFASFITQQPAALAADLADCKGVEMTSYADGDAVVALSPDGGRAEIRKRDGRYIYTTLRGDPLKLLPILARLSADEDNSYDPDDLLAATVDHEFPAPLQRLWRAHFGLVKNPPDVICSLANGYYFGNEEFAERVDIASTHGALNRSNSVTFIMSTAGPLPPVLRSADVATALEDLTGLPLGK